jgi:hypothetical protein
MVLRYVDANRTLGDMAVAVLTGPWGASIELTEGMRELR